VKILILHLTIAALCLVGCTAVHYHERQADRITFYLKISEAEKVDFVSSLDDFSPHMANKLKDSRWVVTVSAKSEFRYFYIVDGAVHVPECRFYEKDDFGSRNCIYVPE
jgi:hypothetical protein